MSTQMEQSIWARQKQSVVQGFIDERKKLVSAVAGRGFLLAPGFLYEFETGLEIDTKQKLSDVSFKILSDAVERDLKQAGLDYSLAYKDTVTVWELEKQRLLTEWDKELIGIKKIRSDKEEVLNQLEIQISLRGVALVNAKTGIELNSEALKLQLANLDGQTTPYEVQLAQQKVLTAQRKLLVIPILQQILAVEQLIIAKEQLVVVKEQQIAAQETVKIREVTTLAGKETDIVNKKRSELLPAIREEVAANGRLNIAITAETALEKLIMNEKVTSAGIMVDKANKQTLIIDKEVEIEGKQIEIMDISVQKDTKQVEIFGIEAEGMGKQVQLAGLAVDKLRKQKELVLKDISYETRRLELMDIAIDKSAQNILLADEEVKFEQEQVNLAQIAVDKIDKGTELAQQEIRTLTENIKHIGIKTQISEQQSANALLVAQTSKTSMTTLDAAQTASNASIIGKEQAVRNDVSNKTSTLSGAKIAQELTSATTSATAHVDSSINIDQIKGYEATAIADINAAKTLTANLVHLIG